MLTTDDLKAIQGLVREEIRREIDPLRNDVSELRVDVSSLKVDVSELRVDVSILKDDMKVAKRSIKKVEKTVDVMIDFFNTEDVKLKKRVEKIESHLGIVA